MWVSRSRGIISPLESSSHWLRSDSWNVQRQTRGRTRKGLITLLFLLNNFPTVFFQEYIKARVAKVYAKLDWSRVDSTKNEDLDYR